MADWLRFEIASGLQKVQEGAPANAVPWTPAEGPAAAPPGAAPAAPTQPQAPAEKEAPADREAAPATGSSEG